MKQCITTAILLLSVTGGFSQSLPDFTFTGIQGETVTAETLPDTLDLVAVQLDEGHAPGNDGVVVICSQLPNVNIQRDQRLLVLTVDQGHVYGQFAFADEQRLIIEGREVLTSSIRECWKVEWEIGRVS